MNKEREKKNNNNEAAEHNLKTVKVILGQSKNRTQYVKVTLMALTNYYMLQVNVIVLTYLPFN